MLPLSLSGLLLILLLPFTPQASLMGALFQAGGTGGNAGAGEIVPLAVYGLGEEAGIRYEGPTVIHLQAPLSYGEPEVFIGNGKAAPE